MEIIPRKILLPAILFLGLLSQHASFAQMKPAKLDTGKVDGKPYPFQPLKFTRKSTSYSFRKFRPLFKLTADSALFIAAAVLNSQEFRDSIARHVFPCKNYDEKCDTKCTDCENGTIAAKIICDSLYRKMRDSIKLVLNNDGKCAGAFGFSYEDNFTITSHYITINCDTLSEDGKSVDTLSFACRYAYHLCHEYMHIVGFYHFQEPEYRERYKDIAEATGWIAYYILKRWQDNHLYLFNGKPWKM